MIQSSSIADDLLMAAAQVNLSGLLVDMEDMSVWVKDTAHCYRFVNRGFLLNYGVDHADEVLGKNDFELNEESIAAQFRHDDELVLTGQVIRNRMEVVGRFDHVQVWCLTTKMPIRNSDGIIMGTTGMCRPVPDDVAGHHCMEDKPLAQVVAYIRENITNSCDNQHLAALCHLSTRAFERKFRSTYHATPQSYVRQLRIRMACQMLVASNRSLAEIAATFGFCDQSHFGREFLRETGLSPSAYRKRFNDQETQQVRVLPDNHR